MMRRQSSRCSTVASLILLASLNLITVLSLPSSRSESGEHLIVLPRDGSIIPNVGGSRSAKLLSDPSEHHDHEHKEGHSANDGHSHSDHHRNHEHDHGPGHSDNDGHDHAHFIVTSNDFGAQSQFFRSSGPIRSQKLIQQEENGANDSNGNGDGASEARSEDDGYLGTLPGGFRLFGSLANPEAEREIVKAEEERKAKEKAKEEASKNSGAKNEGPKNETFVTIIRHHNPQVPNFLYPNIYISNAQNPRHENRNAHEDNGQNPRTHVQMPTQPVYYPGSYSYGYTIPSYYQHIAEPVWYNHYPTSSFSDLSGHPIMRSHAYYTSPFVTYHYIVSHDGTGIIGTKPGVVTIVPREENPSLPPSGGRQPQPMPSGGRQPQPMPSGGRQPQPGVWQPMPPRWPQPGGRPVPREPSRPRKPQPEEGNEENDREPLEPEGRQPDQTPPPMTPLFPNLWPMLPPGYIPMPPMQPVPMPPRPVDPMPPTPPSEEKEEKEEDDGGERRSTTSTTTSTTTTTTEAPAGEKEENDKEETSGGGNENSPVVLERMIMSSSTTTTPSTTTSTTTTEAPPVGEKDEEEPEKEPKEETNEDSKEGADEDPNFGEGNNDEGLARESDDDFTPKGPSMDEEEEGGDEK